MDIKTIEEIIKVLEGSRAEELTVSKGDNSVLIRKGNNPKPVEVKAKRKEALPEITGPAVEQPTNEMLILAPMVGLFHSADGIAREGKEIAAGQVVGTIESMKLLNDVISEVSGTVVEVMVEDGIPVEYGQTLYKIAPKDS